MLDVNGRMEFFDGIYGSSRGELSHIQSLQLRYSSYVVPQGHAVMEIKDQKLLRPQGEDENGSNIESVMTWEKEKNMTRMKY